MGVEVCDEASVRHAARGGRVVCHNPRTHVADVILRGREKILVGSKLCAGSYGPCNLQGPLRMLPQFVCRFVENNRSDRRIWINLYSCAPSMCASRTTVILQLQTSP